MLPTFMSWLFIPPPFFFHICFFLKSLPSKSCSIFSLYLQSLFSLVILTSFCFSIPSSDSFLLAVFQHFVMYNFFSMSGWHQLRCDQIFYPEGCNVSVKRLCALPKQKDSLCTIISRPATLLSPIQSLCYHLSYDRCPWSRYLHVPVLVTVTY